MKVCAVVFKECWQNGIGEWHSTGGYPMQMAALTSLFDSATLIVAKGVERKSGGISLPHGVEVIPLPLPGGKDLKRKIRFLLRLPYYAARVAVHVIRADVVYAPPPGDIPLLGLVLGVLFQKRLIVRYAGSWVSNDQTTPANRVVKYLMRSWASDRRIMLATGEGTGQPCEGLSWIFSSALSEAEISRDPAAVTRPTSEPPRLAYVGRLSAEKGVGYLIQAMALLAGDSRLGKAILTIVGDGPERRSLGGQVLAAGLAERIVWTGQLNRPELLDLLRVTDLCVQPSLTEGYSKAWLDAFGVGTPVLSSNVGAAAEVIGRSGERGWLIPPANANAIADALRLAWNPATDWYGLRSRCINYAEQRTLEEWACHLGRLCAERWNLELREGRLHDTAI